MKKVLSALFKGLERFCQACYRTNPMIGAAMIKAGDKKKEDSKIYANMWKD